MKREGYYRIAGIEMKMTFQYAYTENLCRDYRIERPEAEPKLQIEVTEEEILREKTEISDVRYLESLAIYRKICEAALAQDTFLMHGSAVAVDGRAYIFTAPSGTGKSTHVRLWREYFGERAIVVNDDKPLLQVREDGIYVCGTPWCGKHSLNTNCIVPLGGICVLQRGEQNVAEAIPVMEAYPYLYRQTYHPKDRGLMLKTMGLLKQLAERVPMYRLQCTISEEAVLAVWNAMNAEK